MREADRKMFERAEGQKHMASDMRTPFPSVNAMGVRPQSNEGRHDGGIESRGKIGEVRASGVVARGKFGGTREMEGRVKAGGRGMGRRERGR